MIIFYLKVFDENYTSLPCVWFIACPIVVILFYTCVENVVGANRNQQSNFEWIVKSLVYFFIYILVFWMHFFI